MALPLRMPYFCRGPYENLLSSMEEEGIFSDLDKVIYCFLTDPEHENQLALVYPDKTIHFITVDMTAINEAIESLRDTDVTIQNNIEIIEGDVSSLRNLINETITTLNNHATLLSEHTESIANFNDDISDIFDNMMKLEGMVSNSSDRIQILENSLSEIQSDYITSGKLGDVGSGTVQNYVDDSVSDALEIQFV